MSSKHCDEFLKLRQRGKDWRLYEGWDTGKSSPGAESLPPCSAVKVGELGWSPTVYEREWSLFQEQDGIENHFLHTLKITPTRAQNSHSNKPVVFNFGNSKFHEKWLPNYRYNSEYLKYLPL